jgi:hypothetical protein
MRLHRLRSFEQADRDTICAQLEEDYAMLVNDSKIHAIWPT